jgi:hypothetical protein
VIENSGWEFDLTTITIQKGDFRWKTAVNLSIPKNKLVSYPDLSKSSYANRYEIGRPIFLTPRYHYTGINPQSGLYTFEDINGDGNITTAQDRRLTFIGQRFFGGLSNTFSYKGIELDVFVQFVKQTGNKLYSFYSPGSFFASGSNQQRYIIEDIKDPSKTQPYTASLGGQEGTAYTNFIASNAGVGDASFIRFKNVSLSWEVPATINKAAHINAVRIFARAQNILTITKYRGIDPETSFNVSSGLLTLPPLKMISFGLQIQL